MDSVERNYFCRFLNRKCDLVPEKNDPLGMYVSPQPMVVVHSGKGSGKTVKRKRRRIKKVIPLNEIEDVELRIRQNVLLGYSEDGNYLLGYEITNFVDLFESFDNCLNFVFFHFHNENMRIVPSLTVPFCGMPVPKAMQLPSNVEFQKGFQNGIKEHVSDLSGVHIRSSNSLDTKYFYNSLYFEESPQRRKHIVTIFDNPLHANNLRSNIIGLFIHYFTIDNSNVFNAQYHVLKHSVLIPTSSSIDILYLTDKTAKRGSSSQLSAPCVDFDPVSKKSGSNVSFCNILLRHQKTTTGSVGRTKSVIVYSHEVVDIEICLLGERMQSFDVLKHYDFRILFTAPTDEEAFMVVLATLENPKREIRHRRLALFCSLSCDLHKVVVLEEKVVTANIAFAKHFRGLCEFYTRKFHTEVDVSRQKGSAGRMRVLSNENMFTSGKSLEYIIHPKLPICIKTPNKKE